MDVAHTLSSQLGGDQGDLAVSLLVCASQPDVSLVLAQYTLVTLRMSYLEAPTCVPIIPLPYSIQHSLKTPDVSEHAVLAMTQAYFVVQSTTSITVFCRLLLLEHSSCWIG